MADSKTLFKIMLLLVLIVVAMIVITSLLNPPKADYRDYVFEDVGGDGFLKLNLSYNLKIREENIPDSSFNTHFGEIKYFDAKRITYVGSYGDEGHIIVWKTTPDKYSWFDDEDINQYVSTYLTDGEGKCFVIYSFENNYVYGVMLSTDLVNYTESQFLYKILNLDEDEFELSYSQYPSSGYSSGYSSGGDHYHTVVPDRYTLSRTDPGAYYDHYEYGDNYDIDDYLESEGYD